MSKLQFVAIHAPAKVWETSGKRVVYPNIIQKGNFVRVQNEIFVCLFVFSFFVILLAALYIAKALRNRLPGSCPLGFSHKASVGTDK